MHSLPAAAPDLALPPVPPPPPNVSADLTAQVLLESSCWLVLNKPAGLLCVPGRGEERRDCLLQQAEQRWGRLWVVHRLDQATSGLVVLARSPQAQVTLSRAFENRRVEKRYAARVHGHCPGQGQIDLPLGPDWPNRPRQKLDRESGRSALTRWQQDPRSAEKPLSCATTDLLLWPVTGRTHQLRVHMLSMGHPIVGDTLYGAKAAARLMLHAEWLRIADPSDGKPVDIACPPPWLG